MRWTDSALTLSPSDLSNFLSCRHRTGLDLAGVHGVLRRPKLSNPYAAILSDHGEQHEQRYVEALRAEGLTIVNARPQDDTTAARSLELTLDAMRSGVDVIVQARLEGDGFAGYADVLRRVERPSALGAWSYEAQDTKLARETKGGTILQLSAYSDMLAGMQGARPEHFYVVTPGGPEGPLLRAEEYRVADYAAYYRMVLRTLREDVAKGHERLLEEYYPEPVEACQLCAWVGRCEARRRQDDHLSYIAGAGRTHRVELTAQGVPTLTAAAEMTVPVAFKPSRGSRETYNRLGHQARVQHQQRTEHRPIVERLPLREGEGLYRLPAPSPGDVFLDLEGAAFAREGGREFLFGLWMGTPKGVPYYRAWWAVDDASERAAFEEVMDVLTTAWQADPEMHIYHFNHYEPTAFKKLASRYVTRVEPLNELLRAERFIDLYPIVRQAARCGVESYSIKKLEQYYAFTRQMPLENVRQPLMAVELALESGGVAALEQTIRDAVQGYNEDDCRSTEALRDWLEDLRAQTIADGSDVPRPSREVSDPPKITIELQQRAEALRERLLARAGDGAEHPSHPNHATWLLAYLVDWHKREINAEWWEYFRLRDLPEEDLFDERKAVAGMAFVDRVEVVRRKDNNKPTGSVIDRYRYPPQEIDIKGRLKLQDGKTFGTTAAHDRTARTLDIKKGKAMADTHATAAFSADPVPNAVLQQSVLRLAEAVLDETGASDRCGPQLLHLRPPRLRTGAFGIPDGSSAQDYAVAISTHLDRTVLPIQGPPGAGKTFVGAQMIRALVKAGKKVGVTATSHKVIRNLLDEVAAQALEAKETVRIAAKGGDGDDEEDAFQTFKENNDALAAVRDREVDVLGGTAWLWADEDAAEAVDVLFVDEAGQMSLANVLAVSQAADSLVLLGDPSQLDQPEKTSHPDGVGISALEHVLGRHETMPPERGIFLPETWRMSPTLTAFTSELFYANKLKANPGLERQALSGLPEFEGSHLWLVPVAHDGCQSASDEEVEAVAALVDRLLTTGSLWVNEKGSTQQITGADIRVVAPFNAQVNRIRERLGGTEVPPLRHVPVGTVDKFQGQTCAVVIYSMATSRPEDAPRGLEFLFSLNRLNVATSRARCAVFLVASPHLFQPECRTPRQMQLANALCRYVELSRRLAAD